MKRRLFSIICVLIIILSAFSACKKQTTAHDVIVSSSAQSIGEGKNTFVFTVVDDSGEQEVFNISTNQKLVGDALKELDLISGDEGDFGLYVKTVNGKTFDYNKDGKYWAFYINGEYAVTGVDKTEISGNDTYMFKVE